MQSVRLLVGLMVLLLACRGQQERIIQAGVLLPYSGSLSIGYGISGAVPLAIEFIQMDPSFEFFRSRGYSINFTIVDCPCDAGPGLAAFSDLYAVSNPPIDVYIGRLRSRL
jgi:hypothetical protein